MNGLINFQHLLQKFGVGNTQFPDYPQLKSAILSKILRHPSSVNYSALIEKMLKHSGLTKLLSKMYIVHLSISTNVDFWIQICNNIFNQNNNTNSQQSKLYWGESDSCTHCSQNTTNRYLRVTWHCSPIRHFWLQVTDRLPFILDCHIPLSAEFCNLSAL